MLFRLFVRILQNTELSVVRCNKHVKDCLVNDMSTVYSNSLCLFNILSKFLKSRSEIAIVSLESLENTAYCALLIKSGNFF